MGWETLRESMGRVGTQVARLHTPDSYTHSLDNARPSSWSPNPGGSRPEREREREDGHVESRFLSCRCLARCVGNPRRVVWQDGWMARQRGRPRSMCMWYAVLGLVRCGSNHQPARYQGARPPTPVYLHCCGSRLAALLPLWSHYSRRKIGSS